MFDWFKKPEYNGMDGSGYQPLPTPSKYPTMPETTMTTTQPKCHFKVGTNTAGQTVLTVGDGYTVDLTMGEDAVRQLVRLLEATLPVHQPIVYDDPDPSICPGCGGPADNGHDRSFPPNPYFCTKCEDQE